MFGSAINMAASLVFDFAVYRSARRTAIHSLSQSACHTKPNARSERNTDQG